jgi:secondary thiamine-phosphate synthase enzyme
MTYQERIQRGTSGHGDTHDLTGEVARVVAASGIRTGIVHVFHTGSTAGVALIEYESGLRSDLPAALQRLLPPGLAYEHEAAWHDGNAHSHLQATLLGFAVTVPVADGQPVLGTWQQVVLLECDTRPRRREVVLTVLGDP